MLTKDFHELPKVRDKMSYPYVEDAMTVMILESVSPSLRGQMTRWLLEPKAGVFVGRVSAMVRDRLWEKVCKATKGGGAILVYSAKNEQGFAIRFWGKTTRWITDWEGLLLVTKPKTQ